jgi:hypothetical protein
MVWWTIPPSWDFTIYINLAYAFFITFVHSQENKVYASCKFVEHVEQFGGPFWTRTSKNSGILDLESLSMGTTISSNSISRSSSPFEPVHHGQTGYRWKIEIFVGGEEELNTTLPLSLDDNENVGMLPNNARIYDLNYNATISATLLVRHYDGKEKASLKSTRSTSLPSRSCLFLYLCASRPITQNADLCRRMSVRRRRIFRGGRKEDRRQ